jgi:biopolymer transport protein ExbB
MKQYRGINLKRNAKFTGMTWMALGCVLATSTYVWGQENGMAPAPGPESAAPAPEGFFDIVFSGGWVGAIIVLLLLALSITAAYLVIEHLLTIRRKEIMPDGLGEEVRTMLSAGRIADADQACRAKPSFLSFVLLNGIAEIEGGWSAVEKAIEDATAEQSARLFRKIEYLSVIGNIAPMVGLLGTVTGMIFAFQRVAVTQGSAGAGDLAEGIYQALVTTVGGLIVAIPSLGAFAIFRNRVDQFVAEAAYMAQHVFTPLKRRRTSSTAKSTPPPPPAKEAR